MRVLLCVWLTGFASIAVAAAPAPAGTFENSACLACHQQHSAELVAAWHKQRRWPVV